MVRLVCEAFVIVLQYIDREWVIKRKVCCLMLLAKSITGEEVAQELITAVSTKFSITPNSFMEPCMIVYLLMM